MGTPQRFRAGQRRLVGEHGERAVPQTRRALEPAVGLVIARRRRSTTMPRTSSAANASAKAANRTAMYATPGSSGEEIEQRSAARTHQRCRAAGQSAGQTRSNSSTSRARGALAAQRRAAGRRSVRAPAPARSSCCSDHPCCRRVHPARSRRASAMNSGTRSPAQDRLCELPVADHRPSRAVDHGDRARAGARCRSSSSLRRKRPASRIATRAPAAQRREHTGRARTCRRSRRPGRRYRPARRAARHRPRRAARCRATHHTSPAGSGRSSPRRAPRTARRPSPAPRTPAARRPGRPASGRARR